MSKKDGMILEICLNENNSLTVEMSGKLDLSLERIGLFLIGLNQAEEELLEYAKKRKVYTNKE